MTPASSDFSRTAGLVLAGGRSSRFGSDKALARFRGELLLDRALRPLQILPAIAISAKASSAIGTLARERGVTVLTDDPNHPAGPLTGILAGMDWANEHGFQFLATVPCDMPLLPLGFVPTLLSSIGSSATAYARTADGDHPLCAVWDTDLRIPLRSTLAAGSHPPVRAFLTETGAKPVWFESVDAFVNANTRDILVDLEQSV